MYKSTVDWLDELDNIKTHGTTGMPIQKIADIYGVSKQRLHQIIKRYIPEWGDMYGGIVRRRIVADTYHNKWGTKESTDLYRAKRDKYNRKKANAIKVGYTWSIHFGDLTWPTHCPILGIELDYFAETRQENSISFDRVNNSLGYDSGNVVIISWRANRIKNDGTAEEHELIAEYIRSTQ